MYANTIYFVELSSCVTPNYEDGECIDLKNCPSLLKVFHRYAATKSESDRQFLQKSQCKTKKITVCCPIESEVDLLPSAPECGLSLTDKIFGGTRTELTEFPWTALLGKIRSNGPVEFFCGGSLISNRYVY